MIICTPPNAVDETKLSASQHTAIDTRAAGRFAPSITGSAHPGTLLAALLGWLDARSVGARFVLRLEDLDHTRLRDGQREEMLRALAWLGLDWDELAWQSRLSAQHQAALDTLAGEGRLYPCVCSRKERRQAGRLAPDGSVAYDNRCRGRALPSAGWRAATEALRVQLPDAPVLLQDLSGLDLSQQPSLAMGDPIVRRRDGVIAYHLVVVVDDAASGVTRVVRGRDLATSTATQVQLCDLLGLPIPSYRHHFLLLEETGQKLAKLHASMPFATIEAHYNAESFCAHLAALAGLRKGVAQPCTPQDLLADFSWERVRTGDLLFAKV